MSSVGSPKNANALPVVWRDFWRPRGHFGILGVMFNGAPLDIALGGEFMSINQF